MKKEAILYVENFINRSSIGALERSKSYDFDKICSAVIIATRRKVKEKFYEDVGKMAFIREFKEVVETVVKTCCKTSYEKKVKKATIVKHGLRRRVKVPKSVVVVNSAIPDNSAELEDEMMDVIPDTGIVVVYPKMVDSIVACKAGWGDPKTSSTVPIMAKKHAKAVINSKKIVAWNSKTRRNFQSQNAVMGCSALEEVTTAKLTTMLQNTDQCQWEWLHLISFKMGGADGTVSPQVATNLVAGTYACNTEMINIEEAIKSLAAKGNSFEVDVVADMYVNCHVALEITYTVKCNSKTLVQRYFPMRHNDVMSGSVKLTADAFKTYFGIA